VAGCVDALVARQEGNTKEQGRGGIIIG